MKKSLATALLLLLTSFQSVFYADNADSCAFKIAAFNYILAGGDYHRVDQTANDFDLSEVTRIGDLRVTSQQFLGGLLAYLAGLQSDDLVLVVDGNHTIFAGDCSAIQNAFYSLHTKFAISASRCHPSVDDVNRFPAGDDVFSYLNGGGFMGYVSQTKKIIQRLYNLSIEHPTFTINQLFNLDYSKHRKEYKVDHNARLFLDTAGISPGNGDVTIQDIFPYVITHLHDAENSNPVVIHSEGSGGGGDEVVQAIFEAIDP